MLRADVSWQLAGDSHTILPCVVIILLEEFGGCDRIVDEACKLALRALLYEVFLLAFAGFYQVYAIRPCPLRRLVSVVRGSPVERCRLCNLSLADIPLLAHFLRTVCRLS